ncbi:hypothetical protein LTR84_009522 [Exophiala bonariae]|uniref:Uncharacterized protein n=1 Tax=Exophiala bonariae TaxID=1690606 RepID=A0AAV9MU65_9EURO|nr:hypothetical protein LTR84_009522 [Exophiala bonariae]
MTLKITALLTLLIASVSMANPAVMSSKARTCPAKYSKLACCMPTYERDRYTCEPAGGLCGGSQYCCNDNKAHGVIITAQGEQQYLRCVGINA